MQRETAERLRRAQALARLAELGRAGAFDETLAGLNARGSHRSAGVVDLLVAATAESPRTGSGSA